MDKLNIYVILHKPVDVFHNNVYIPIQVGASLNNLSEDYVKDNVGDNISIKNPYYCELTALYWAWKNVNCEYIGFCHYRRYFEKEFTKDNISEELSGFDALVVQHTCFTENILDYFINQLVPEDIHLFFLYMQQRFPDQKSMLDSYFVKGNSLNPANMIVCKKTLFDDYSEWLFSILFDLEKILKFSEYTNARRIMGYLGEMLLGYYIYSHSLKVKEMNIIPMLGEHLHLVKYTWKDKFKAWRRFGRKKNTIVYNVPPQIMIGFEKEGLLSKIKNTVQKYSISRE